MKQFNIDVNHISAISLDRQYNTYVRLTIKYVDSFATGRLLNCIDRKTEAPPAKSSVPSHSAWEILNLNNISAEFTGKQS